MYICMIMLCAHVCCRFAYTNMHACMYLCVQVCIYTYIINFFYYVLSLSSTSTKQMLERKTSGTAVAFCFDAVKTVRCMTLFFLPLLQKLCIIICICLIVSNLKMKN